MPALIRQLIARHVLYGRVALVVSVIWLLVVLSNPDRDVGSDRVREEAAGRIAVDNLDSARRLLYLELVGDTVVAGGQCCSNALLWSGPRQYGFWFFFLVVLLIADGI